MKEIIIPPRKKVYDNWKQYFHPEVIVYDNYHIYHHVSHVEQGFILVHGTQKMILLWYQ